MLTLIFVELTPSPSQRMRVRNVGAGEAAITTKQIAQRIDAEVRQAPQVAGCESTVVARGRRVEVILDLHVAPEADLSRTADEACRRAHTLVEQQLGIELAAKPRARLHYRELRLRDEPGTHAEGARRDWAQGHERAPRDTTGWEQPNTRPGAAVPHGEGTRDERGNADTSQEAQA